MSFETASFEIEMLSSFSLRDVCGPGWDSTRCISGSCLCSMRRDGHTHGRIHLHSAPRQVCIFLLTSFVWPNTVRILPTNQVTTRAINYEKIWKHLSSGITHYCAAPTVQVGFVVLLVCSIMLLKTIAHVFLDWDCECSTSSEARQARSSDHRWCGTHSTSHWRTGEGPHTCNTCLRLDVRHLHLSYHSGFQTKLTST